tara:strand:- start:91 stop:1275 length:1185 start_codon:yes stop_codon:yes gene_type:complete
MKKLLILLTLFAFTLQSNAQSWKKSSGGDAFDGKYRTSSVRGSGGDFPYENPTLVINKFDSGSLNFYISGAGYWQSGTGVSVRWVFSNEPNTIYSTYDFSFSSDGKIIFLEEFNNPANNAMKLSKKEFIKKLQVASNVQVRISNDYGSNSMRFSLSGSTNAINFVLPNLAKDLKDLEIANKIKLEGFKVQDSLVEVAYGKFRENFTRLKFDKYAMKKVINHLLENEKEDALINFESVYFKKGTYEPSETYRYVDAYALYNDGTSEQIDGIFNYGEGSDMAKEVIAADKIAKEAAKLKAEKEKKDAYEKLDVLVNRLESNLVIKKVKEKLFNKYQINLINKVEFKYKNYGYDVYGLTIVLNGDEDEYTSISLSGIGGKEFAKIIKSKDLKPETLF